MKYMFITAQYLMLIELKFHNDTLSLLVTLFANLCMPMMPQYFKESKNIKMYKRNHVPGVVLVWLLLLVFVEIEKLTILNELVQFHQQKFGTVL